MSPRRRFWFVWLALLAVIAGLTAIGYRKRQVVSRTWDWFVEGLSPVGTDWFEDATSRLGVEFVHDAGPTGKYFMPQVTGGGCALFDADGDDRLDILLLQNAGPKSASRNQLYQQQPDGTFRNVSAGCGLDFAGNNTGVAIGDVNNDGKPDVLVTQYHGARLLVNRGGCRFDDVTPTAGITNLYWGTSASFVDYDRDGWLDLLIANYVDYDGKRNCFAHRHEEFCGPKQFPGSPAHLFRNLGGSGGGVRFRDVSQSSGIAAARSSGLGVYCADLTADGWPDLFIANDLRPNHLWVNQKNGTFREEAVPRGIALAEHGGMDGNMGVAVGDFDSDGLTDLFVTHQSNETHTLWRQDADGLFSDVTARSRAATTRLHGTGFGAVMTDFDRDGHPDIAIANGNVSAPQRKDPGNSAAFWRDYHDQNQLMWNRGDGSFVEVSRINRAFCGYGNVGRGLATGDVNRDGRPDLLVTDIGGPARLLLNKSPDKNHWLAVRCLLPSGRDAIGAEVRLQVGERVFFRTVQPAESYLSSSSPELLFGLGVLPTVREIAVRWPDGSSETFPGGSADQRLQLRYGGGKRKGIERAAARG